MSNWKKEFKKDLDENLSRETPRIEKLKKTETKKKRLPLWGKILIPFGAAAALTLAVALPLTLRKNEMLSDGDVFLKARDALAELAKSDSSNSWHTILETNLSLAPPSHSVHETSRPVFSLRGSASSSASRTWR